MIKYVFRDVVTIKDKTKADPQKIGEALAKIAADAEGELRPLDVVETARNSRHILHKHFTWSDEAAANQWRLEEARNLIQCIRLVDDAGEDGSIRAFVSVAAESGTSYRTVSEIRSSPDLQVLVLESAERDLESFQRRYRELTDICSMVRAAQEAVSERRKTLAKKDKEPRIGA